MDKFSDLVSLSRSHAQRIPSDTAYTYETDTVPLRWTFGDLDTHARRVAAQLQAANAKGERALLLYPPSTDFLAGFFGCLYAGTIAVPAHPPRWPIQPTDSKLRRLLAVARDAAPTVILTVEKVRSQVANFASALPELSTVQWIATDVEDGASADDWQPFTPTPDSLAFLQYTSGSTDRPKGVMVSHENIFANERMIHRAFRVQEDSVGGGWVPLFHDMGLIGHVLGALYSGSPCHLMNPLSFLKRPASWLELITRYGITHSTSPDFAYRMCTERVTDEEKAALDLSSWGLALNGAEPVRRDTLEQFSAAFESCGFRSNAFFPSYGLAEATLFVSGALETREPIVVSARRDMLEGGLLIPAGADASTKEIRELVGCGVGAIDQRLEIVDPQTRLALPEGRVGEIWVAGDHIPRGYWNQPELTAERYGVSLADSDEKIFLRTGDMGVMSKGELFVTGRRSDLIIVRGTNHHPEDIEHTIGHLDARFLMPCVTSVEVDGQERVLVVQEVKRGFPQEASDELAASIRKALAESHGLDLYACLFIEQGSMPRTSSGKVQRALCARLFQKGNLDVVAEWNKNDAHVESTKDVEASVDNTSGHSLKSPFDSALAKQIESWLAKRVGALIGIESHEIDVHRHLAEYGLDSAASVMLAGELEQWLGLTVPETISWDHPNIAAISAFMATEASRSKAVDETAVDSAPSGAPNHLYTQHCRPVIGEMLSALRLDVIYERADGNRLFHRDESGSEKEVLDFLGGYGALVFGHNHPELVSVVQKHLSERRPFLAQLSCREPAGRLGARLNDMMVARTGRPYITTLANTGAEAVEAAMKHAEFAKVEEQRLLQDELSKKEAAIRRGLREGRYRLSKDLFASVRTRLAFSGREDFDSILAATRAFNHHQFDRPSRFVSLEGAFHGKTLGAVSLTHYHGYRDHFAHASPSSIFVKAGDVQALEDAAIQSQFTYLSFSVNDKDEVVLNEQARNGITALFIEPIQGEGGIHVLPKDYLQRCRSLADEHGFPLVFDEVQCGMGRTGTFLYSEQVGVFADYYVLSKALGGGLTKVAALLVDRAHYRDDFGLIHTSTFGEDELSSEVALRCLELLEEETSLMRNCVDRGEQMLRGLRALQQDYPGIICEVRGTGLMLGVELEPADDNASPTIRNLAEQDLLSYVIGGYLLHEHGIRLAPCTSNRSTIRLEPSALIQREDCEHLLSALEEVCQIIATGDGFSLLRYLVGRERQERTPFEWGSIPSKAPALYDAGDAHVAFVGYFLEPAHMRDWDPSLSAFTDDELANLIERMHATLDPFTVSEEVVHSAKGRRVRLSVIGIPVDATRFSRLMSGPERALLSQQVETAVHIAADRGCTVAALGGFTSIVTGNAVQVRNERIAVTTGNSLTVAMGYDAIIRAAKESSIPLNDAVFAVVGAAGNIARTYTHLLAQHVAHIMLIGRAGKTEQLRDVAADLYYETTRELAHAKGELGLSGLGKALWNVQAVTNAIHVGIDTIEPRSLLAAIESELGERAPITISSDLRELSKANLILGASNSTDPLIHGDMLGKQNVVLCNVAVPTDVHDSVYDVANVHVVEGGLVRLPIDRDFNVEGLHLPPGHAHACCCEGLVMGLSGMRESYSLGAISKQQVLEIRALAALHGFSLADSEDTHRKTQPPTIRRAQGAIS